MKVSCLGDTIAGKPGSFPDLKAPESDNSASVFPAHRWSILPLLVFAAALLIVIHTFKILAPILLSFLLTMLISLALNPIINRLRGLTGGRKLATGLVFAALVTLLGLTGWAFFQPLKTSVTKFSEVLPEYWERLQKPLIKMEKHAEKSEEKLQSQVSRELANTDLNASATPSQAPDPTPSELPPPSNSIRSGLGEMIRGVLGGLTAVAFNGAQVFVVLVTVFFSVIFTLMNPRPIIGTFFALVPVQHHGKALIIMQRICRFAPAWGGSTAAGMLTIGLLVFLFMWPILGFMDALVLGLIAGILESVPFIGPTLSTVPALLLAFGNGGMTPLWVLLAYVIIQILENNVILPVIMARGMQVHAVAVIFSMLLCVAAFGVLGVLIAAPMVAIVSILNEELFRKRFPPTITDFDLDRLARRSLNEKQMASN